MGLLHETLNEARRLAAERWIAPTLTMLLLGAGGVAQQVIRGNVRGFGTQSGAVWVTIAVGLVIGLLIWFHVFLYLSGETKAPFLHSQLLKTTMLRFPRAVLTSLVVILRSIPYLIVGLLVGNTMSIAVMMASPRLGGSIGFTIVTVSISVAPYVWALVKFGTAVPFALRGDFGIWKATKASKVLFRRHRNAMFIIASPAIAYGMIAAGYGALTTVAPEVLRTISGVALATASTFLALPAGLATVVLYAAALRVYLTLPDEPLPSASIPQGGQAPATPDS